MIIRALPALGKTWLARNSTNWVDTDDLLVEIVGDASKSTFDKVIASKELTDQLTSAVKNALEDGKHVVTNFDPSVVGMRANVVVQMQPDDYIEHIRTVGRNDLLDNFSLEELKGWAAAKADAPVLMMKPGQHLSEVVALLRV